MPLVCGMGITFGYWPSATRTRPDGVYLDTGKKHSDGTPVRQIKWYGTVAGLLAVKQVGQGAEIPASSKN